MYVQLASGGTLICGQVLENQPVQKGKWLAFNCDQTSAFLHLLYFFLIIFLVLQCLSNGMHELVPRIDKCFYFS